MVGALKDRDSLETNLRKMVEQGQTVPLMCASSLEQHDTALSASY